MSATLERILEEVKSLSATERKQLRELLNEEQVRSDRDARLARIDAACGSLAHLPGSIEEFMQRKREDLHLEEHGAARKALIRD